MPRVTHLESGGSKTCSQLCRPPTPRLFSMVRPRRHREQTKQNPSGLGVATPEQVSLGSVPPKPGKTSLCPTSPHRSPCLQPTHTHTGSSLLRSAQPRDPCSQGQWHSPWESGKQGRVSSLNPALYDIRDTELHNGSILIHKTGIKPSTSRVFGRIR